MEALIAGVVGFVVFAIALVLGRSWLFSTRLYRPMLLNIALALAPFVVQVVGGGITVLLLVLQVRSWIVIIAFVMTMVVWLLLLPNSGYLITELNLSHRRKDDPVPLWYDIVLVLTLALMGSLVTVLSVGVVHAIATVLLGGETTRSLFTAGPLWIVAVLLVLVPLGMYLGRYPRFNSWDVSNPMRMWRKLRDYLDEEGRVRDMIGFVVIHAVLFALMYTVLVGPFFLSAIQIESIRQV